MRKVRVLVMMDEGLIPPDSVDGMSQEAVAPFRMEWDVCEALRGLGHSVRKVGVKTELESLERALIEFDPHVCFNLLEDFAGISTRDQHVVSYLELLNRPYTGANPRGLTLARDKALTKKVLAYHGIKVPTFQVFPLNRAVRRHDDLPFPMIVKSLIEEGSTGISQASVVTNDEQLRERVEFIHTKLGTDAIAEQYIDGRELYVAVLGNRQLTTFPVWEIDLSNLPADAPRIATRKVKSDVSYQKRHGIVTRKAEGLGAAVEHEVTQLTKKAYRLLELSGYARMDFRLTADNEIYLLEANPNPHIGRGEDFADSAAAAGVGYEALIQKIVTLGLYYQPVGVAA